jgi:hypothetical protein
MKVSNRRRGPLNLDVRRLNQPSMVSGDPFVVANVVASAPHAD